MNMTTAAAAARFLTQPNQAAEADNPWLMATVLCVVSSVYIYRKAMALDKSEKKRRAAAVATRESEKRHAPAAGAWACVRGCAMRAVARKAARFKRVTRPQNLACQTPQNLTVQLPSAPAAGGTNWLLVIPDEAAIAVLSYAQPRELIAVATTSRYVWGPLSRAVTLTQR